MGKTMEEKIDLLKKKLSSYGTKDILGMISLHYVSYGNRNEINPAISFSSDLLSPYQQQLYLAGLLVSTDDESENAQEITSEAFQDKYKELESAIQSITIEYEKEFLAVSYSTTSRKNVQNPIILAYSAGTFILFGG